MVKMTEEKASGAGDQAPEHIDDTDIALRAGGGEMRQSQPESWRPKGKKIPRDYFGYGTDQAWHKRWRQLPGNVWPPEDDHP